MEKTRRRIIAAVVAALLLGLLPALPAFACDDAWESPCDSRSTARKVADAITPDVKNPVSYVKSTAVKVVDTVVKKTTGKTITQHVTDTVRNAKVPKAKSSRQNKTIPGMR